ncbi:hypothetical protein EBB59_13290, partial [Lysobacter pythonis]
MSGRLAAWSVVRLLGIALASLMAMAACAPGAQAMSSVVRAPALPPPAPKPAPLPPTQPATSEPSAAILAARQQNGRLSSAALETRIFRYIDSLQKLEDTHID